MQKCHRALSRGHKDSGNVFCGQRSQLVYRKYRRRVLRAKDKMDPDGYTWKVQKPTSVMVWRCVSAHSTGDLHMCEGTTDADTERHMLPSRWHIFQRSPWLFQQDRCQASFCTKYNSVAFLTQSAYSSDLSPPENVWCIMKRGMRQHMRLLSS